jgi:hypothetical protein
MQAGEVVAYTAYGRTVNAIVLAARVAETGHQGASGEPLVSIAFIDPERESAIAKRQIGWFPQIYVEYDVVHASHEFSAEYKRVHGLTTPAQIAAKRGVGEWTEIISANDNRGLIDEIERLNRLVADLSSDNATPDSAAPDSEAKPE